MNREDIYSGYDAVRDDSSGVNWMLLKYANKEIVVDSTGDSYDDFFSKFTDDSVVFGYVRIYTGDELSRRAKFALLTWIGNGVSPFTKAKVSSEKTRVKEVINNFAVELMISDPEELNEDYIREALVRAGGANYGTGS